MTITLELSDEQAKAVMIVMGSMAGREGSRGVYDMIRSKLRVIGQTPDPRIISDCNTIVVDDYMIQSIRTM